MSIDSNSYDYANELTEWEEDQLDYERQFQYSRNMLSDLGMNEDDFM